MCMQYLRDLICVGHFFDEGWRDLLTTCIIHQDIAGKCHSDRKCFDYCFNKIVTGTHPYSHHPYFCVHTLNNPSAHPSYSYHYLLSPSTLFFAHPIVFCTSYCFLHILLFCTSYCFALFILHILLLFLSFFTIYMLLCCVTLYNYYFLFFCTVHWADLIWLHFTSSYTLYNLLCDK